MRLSPCAATTAVVRHVRAALGMEVAPDYLLRRTMLAELTTGEFDANGDRMPDLVTDIAWGPMLAMMVHIEGHGSQLLALLTLGCCRDADHDPADPDPTEVHVQSFVAGGDGSWRRLSAATVLANGAVVAGEDATLATAAALVAIQAAHAASDVMAVMRQAA